MNLTKNNDTLQTLLYDEMQQKFSVPKVLFSSVSKRCQFSFCLTIPTYGYKFNESTHCSVHKEQGMWKTSMPKKTKKTLCYVCGIRASYGNMASDRRYCKTHMNPLEHWKITYCLVCKRVATYCNGLHTFCEAHASSKCTQYVFPESYEVPQPKESFTENFEETVFFQKEKLPFSPDITYVPTLVENPLEVELRGALDTSSFAFDTPAFIAF